MRLGTRNFARFIALCGICGSSIMCLGAFITALGFKGNGAETYSALNHFISELGNPHWSPWCSIFNRCTMFTGLCLFVFMSGLFFFLHHPLRYAYLLTAMATGICCFLVGWFPADHYSVHIKVATGFFNMALISVLLFSLIVFLENGSKHFERILSYTGLLPFALLSVFAYVRLAHAGEFSRAHMRAMFAHRPDFWLLPFLEWSVFFSMLLWILFISFKMYQKVSKSNPSE
jgi:hypothetical protein